MCLLAKKSVYILQGGDKMNMDALFNTFLHSIAWHTGGKLVNMFFVPILLCFIAYGIYKFVKSEYRALSMPKISPAIVKINKLNIIIIYPLM